MAPPVAAMLMAFSCSLLSGKTAVLWTDRPEFAFYAAEFNTVQDQYKIEVRYFDSPARELVRQGDHPDIVAGSWLKSASTRAFFKPLDRFFGKDFSAFYPRLLAMGSIDDKQFLLPVSFNIPALIFARDKAGLLSNPFTIGFAEMKQLGRDYNIEKDGVYTRMGFSPVWDDNFLFITAVLFRVSFREAEPLAWDAIALERAMSFVYDWINEVNTGSQAGEDFYFKYFYQPPERLALSERILFTYMGSDEFFTLPEERQGSLDFRWIAENGSIPLAESAVYLGLPKKGKAPNAASAFVRWFYQAETQRRLLEQSKDTRAIETSFGVSGGFSALRPVTEQIFPLFYPGLLGHMPPEDFLAPANILPGNWTTLKERVLLPYLRDRARSPDRRGVYPLERRLADWQRVNG
ncbi:MAG: hypothetical protein LBG57_13285 [Treponema sp.]|jgi:ABC-type glycerol-3-phosphate transport system substrate-binding protein|nr:hypothetical protein [Treponema sp.]